MKGSILTRYLRLVPVNRRAGSWNVQRRYEEDFKYVNGQDLTDRHVVRMLEGGPWLGCRALPGPTEHVGVDLDCGSADSVSDRDRRYWTVRELIGMSRRPLVYRTPSGFGLRVYYRIPSTPLEKLVKAQKQGLFANVLRVAGLVVEPGILEIFPQRRHADRLPFGRRMPLLDPDSLQPLLADQADVLTEQQLEQSLDLYEEWSEKPDPGLLAHVETLPSEEEVLQHHDQTAVYPLVPVQSVGAVSEQTKRLLRVGLTQRSTRCAVEWDVGVAMLRDPGCLEDYGLPEHPTEAQVANAVSRWISEHHNGLSKDWSAAVKRAGSVEAAIDWWTERFLARNSSGTNFVNRLQAVVAKIDPAMAQVPYPSGREFDSLLRVSARSFSGPRRFRFLVWACAWLRAVKWVAGKRPRVVNGRVCVELAAKWEQKWPYGKGEVNGTTAYLAFRNVLEREGLVTMVRGYRSPTLKSGGDRELRGEARTWSVRELDRTFAGDLPLRPVELRKILAEVAAARSGRGASIDEAYAVLRLTARGLNMVDEYGKSTGERGKALAADLRDAIRSSVPAISVRVSA